MSGGVEEMYADERMVMLERLKKNAPKSDHYKKLSPEPIDIIEAWKLNYNLGNAVKYIARCNFKGSKKDDLNKAIWYLQRELHNEDNNAF